MPRLLRSIFSKTVGAVLAYVIGEIAERPPQSAGEWVQLGAKVGLAIAARDAVNKVQDAAKQPRPVVVLPPTDLPRR